MPFKLLLAFAASFSIVVAKEVDRSPIALTDADPKLLETALTFANGKGGKAGKGGKGSTLTDADPNLLATALTFANPELLATALKEANLSTGGCT